MEAKIKTRLYFDKEERKKFKIWLIENDLTMFKYANLCGFSRQFVTMVYKGIKPITKNFTKGGYGKEYFDN